MKITYEGKELSLLTEPKLVGKYPIIEYGMGYSTPSPIQYDYEYTAKAVDADGELYKVSWLFEEGEDRDFSTEPCDIEYQ